MIVVQNLASKFKKPLRKTSSIKFLNVIRFPLFACPQLGQKFSCPVNGCPQFKHSGSNIFTAFVFFLFSLIRQEL